MPIIDPVIVVFVGIDGAGKTTQIRAFAPWLCKKYGVRVACAKLAGPGDWTLKLLADRMFGDPFSYHPGIPPSVRSIGCCIDAVSYYFAVLKPLIDSGFSVISDRYGYCEEAYFRAYGADMEWPLRILSLLQTPDICFLLDIPAEQAFSRLASRAVPPNVQEHPGILERVRREYLALSEQHSEFVVIDASRPVTEVQKALRDAFDRRVGGARVRVRERR